MSGHLAHRDAAEAIWAAADDSDVTVGEAAIYHALMAQYELLTELLDAVQSLPQE